MPLMIVPLAIAPGWMLHYDLAPKVTAVAAGAVPALLWMGLRGVRPAHHAVRALLLLFALHAVVLLASTAFSDSPAISLGGSSWRRFGAIPRLAALAVCASLTLEMAARPGYLRHILRMVTLTAIVVSLYATAQYCGWDPWIDREAYTDPYFRAVRPPATLGHAAYLATFLLQTTFASLGLWLIEQHRIWRMLSAVSIAAGHIAIVLSGTRAALGALVFGWLILAALRRPRHIRVAVASALAFFAIVAAFTLSPAGEPIRGRLRQWESDPAGGPRLMVWRDTVQMASARPLAGYGPDTFTLLFPLFQSARLSAAYPNHYHESPHNIFLDASVEAGIAGLALLAATIGVALRWGLRGSRPECAALAAGLGATVLALQFTVFVLPTWLYFLLQTAMLAATAKAPASPAHARPLPVWTVTACRMAALPAAACALAFAIGTAWTEYGWLRAGQLLGEDRVSDAISTWRALPQWPVLAASADLWFARQLLISASRKADQSTSMLEEALHHAEAAVAGSDQPSDAHLIAATVWALRGDVTRTEQHLRSACLRSPQWHKPHWILSKLLRDLGRSVEAEKERRTAIRLYGGVPPEANPR